MIELLVALLIVGVLAALGMDLFRQHDQERLRGAVRLLEQDIEWARTATLTNPDDPASIRMLDDGSGWMVVRQSAPTVPIAAADGSLMHRTLGQGMSEAAGGVQVGSVVATNRLIDFEAYGGVRESGASVELFLPDSGSNCLITFESATGMTQVAWANPEP